MFVKNQSQTVTAYAVLALLIYLTIVAILRKQRLRSTLRSLPHISRRNLSSTSLEDAFKIQQTLSEREFPFTFQKALQFALFRTYGIPSISKLLVQTQQFSEPATACKRYVDTEVLVAEFCQYHPQSERAIEAIARMNYIHSSYQKAGRISNEDMLYTLSLFALEPVRWIERYEWRQLEEFERNALGTFWKAMGDAMAIQYDGLLESAGRGWENGLHWLQDIERWAEEYEKAAMKPSGYNHKTAEQTVAILLWYVPAWAKGFGKQLVCALMDDRLRTAMLYERPSDLYFSLISLIFAIRKFFLRYFFLPRPTFLAKHNTTYERNEHDRYYMNLVDAAPWYARPTLVNRFGPSAWFSRVMGLPVPGDEGNMYHPHGFKTEEIGPNMMKGKGQDYAMNAKATIMKNRLSGCPFGGVKMG